MVGWTLICFVPVKRQLVCRRLPGYWAVRQAMCAAVALPIKLRPGSLDIRDPGSDMGKRTPQSSDSSCRPIRLARATKALPNAVRNSPRTPSKFVLGALHLLALRSNC